MGGLQIPGELLQVALLVLAGARWPEGDEDALRRLAQYHDDEKDAAQQYSEALDASKKMLVEAISGESGKAMDDYLATRIAQINSHKDNSGKLAEACRGAATEIEYTKRIIIGSLILLAAQLIVEGILSGFFGIGAAAAAASIAATRAFVMAALRKLVQVLLTQGFKKVALQQLKRVVVRSIAMRTAGRTATSAAAKMSLGAMAKRQAIMGGVFGGGLDFAVQGSQVLTGGRESINMKQAVISTAAGAVGGVVMAPFATTATRFMGPGASGLTRALTMGASMQVGGMAAAGAGAATSVAFGSRTKTGEWDWSALGKADTWLAGSTGGAITSAAGVNRIQLSHAPESSTTTQTSHTTTTPETTAAQRTGDRSTSSTPQTEHRSTATPTEHRSTQPAASSSATPTARADTAQGATSTPPKTDAATPAPPKASASMATPSTTSPATPATHTADRSATPVAANTDARTTTTHSGGNDAQGVRAAPERTSTGSEPTSHKGQPAEQARQSTGGNDRIGARPDESHGQPDRNDGAQPDKPAQPDRSEGTRAQERDESKASESAVKPDEQQPRPDRNDEPGRSPEDIAQALREQRSDQVFDPGAAGHKPTPVDTAQVHEGAQRTRGLWERLTTGERDAFIAHETQPGRHTEFGDRPGLQAGIRDIFNRHNLVEDVVALHGPEHAQTIRTFARDMDAHLADPSKARPDAPNLKSELPKPEGMREKLASKFLNDPPEVRRIRNVEAAWNEIYSDPPAGSKRQLYIYEPTAFNSDGRIAVSEGNLDTAKNIGVHIPGITTTGEAIGTNLSNASNHHIRAAQSGPENAVLTWIGYDAPSGKVPKLLAETIFPKLAEAGGNRLAHDVAALAGTRTDHPGIHLFGHSYGSTTTAFAGAEGRLGNYVTSVTLLGSPGAGPMTHADNFSSPDHHVPVYVAASSKDLVPVFGSEKPGAGRILHLFGQGIDPASRDFGATRIRAEYASPELTKLSNLGAHTNYFSSERIGLLPDGTHGPIPLSSDPHVRVTESLDNFSHILNNDTNHIQHEPTFRDPNHRFHDPAGGRNAEPASGYPGPNECGRQTIEGFQDRHPNTPVEQIAREHGGSGVTRSEFENALGTKLRDATLEEIVAATRRGENVIVVDTYQTDGLPSRSPGSHAYSVEPNPADPSRPLVYDGSERKPSPWPPDNLNQVARRQIATFDVDGRPLVPHDAHEPTSPRHEQDQIGQGRDAVPGDLPQPEFSHSYPPEHVSEVLDLPSYPPGTLSALETRVAYLTGEHRMGPIHEDMLARGVDAETRARTMFDMRNDLRSWARELMSDRAAANELTRSNPNLTWDEIVAKYETKYHGDQLFETIAERSSHSRPSVNESFGLDPTKPPELAPADTHDRIGAEQFRPSPDEQHWQNRQIERVEPLNTDSEPTRVPHDSTVALDSTVNFDETAQSGDRTNTNEVYKATLDDGSQGIYKPVSGEQTPVRNDVPGDLGKREVAAFRLGEMLGFERMPATSMVDGPHGEGSLQRFVPGEEGQPLHSFSREQQQQLAVLDYVTGNSDRPSGNFLRDAAGNLVAIDHGYTFPEGTRDGIRSDFVRDQLNQPLDPKVLNAVRQVDPAAMRSMLEGSGISPRAADLAISRLTEIQQRGMITGEHWAGPIYDANWRPVHDPQSTPHATAADANQTTGRYPESPASDMTPEQILHRVDAALERANTRFDPYDLSNGYAENCGNVAANMHDFLNGQPIQDAKTGTLDTPQMEARTGLPQTPTTPAQIEATLRAMGPGANMVIGIDRSSGPGHWFNAVFDGKSVWVIDGQDGTRSPWPPHEPTAIRWDASVDPSKLVDPKPDSTAPSNCSDKTPRIGHANDSADGPPQQPRLGSDDQTLDGGHQRPNPNDAVIPILDKYGVSLDEFHAMQEHAAQVGREELGNHFTPEQLRMMYEARMAHPHPMLGEMMQKVIDHRALGSILDQVNNPGSEYAGGRFEPNDAGGCVSVKSDAADLRTPQDLLRALRLDYGEWSPYEIFTTSDHAYIIEGRLAAGDIGVPNKHIADLIGITDGPSVALPEGNPPHTGTGYTGDPHGLNPEYLLNNGKWEQGATVFRVDPDGSRHPVAMFDGNEWVSAKRPDDHVVDAWPKHVGGEPVFPDSPQHENPTHRSLSSDDVQPGHIGGEQAVRAFDEAATPTDAGVAFVHATDAQMASAIQNVPRTHGEFTVDVHGDTHSPILRDGSGNEYRPSPREFSELLRRHGWDGHTPIRLMSCDTGGGQHPFATALARELDVTVTAPDRPVWSYPDGRQPVVSGFERGPNNELRPRIPPDGNWNRFHPDGTVERAGEDPQRASELEGAIARGRDSDDAFDPPPRVRSVDPDAPPFVKWDQPESATNRPPVEIEAPVPARDHTPPGNAGERLAEVPRALAGNEPLQPNTRYNVTYDNGLRTSFLTDEHGRVRWVEADGGMKVGPDGKKVGFNPDLGYPLLPDVKYRVNDNWTFHTDQHGKTDAMSGLPEYRSSDSNYRDDSGKYSAQARAGAEGKAAFVGTVFEFIKWAGGHLAPNESGAPGEYVNMFGQMNASNSGHNKDGWTHEASWRRQEQELAQFADRPGCSIDQLQVQAIRNSDGIPEQVTMRWQQTETMPDGTQVTRTFERVFPNIPQNVKFAPRTPYS